MVKASRADRVHRVAGMLRGMGDCVEDLEASATTDEERRELRRAWEAVNTAASILEALGEVGIPGKWSGSLAGNV